MRLETLMVLCVDLTGNNDVQVGYQYKLEMNSAAVGNSAIPKVTVTQADINNKFIDVPIDAEYFAT